jgi:hypothetical protein
MTAIFIVTTMRTSNLSYLFVCGLFNDAASSSDYTEDVAKLWLVNHTRFFSAITAAPLIIMD